MGDRRQQPPRPALAAWQLPGAGTRATRSQGRRCKRRGRDQWRAGRRGLRQRRRHAHLRPLGRRPHDARRPRWRNEIRVRRLRPDDESHAAKWHLGLDRLLPRRAGQIGNDRGRPARLPRRRPNSNTRTNLPAGRRCSRPTPRTSTYDIGDDGSVFKWWNSAAPPTIEPLMGNLFGSKENQTPISAGDYVLTARAYSPEGIASIDIIANGNQLVDELNCEQDPGKPGLECVNPAPVNEWVMETGGFAPVILWIEVLVTDRIGHTASQRFWVNVPEPPPPFNRRAGAAEVQGHKEAPRGLRSGGELPRRQRDRAERTDLQPDRRLAQPKHPKG